MPSQIATQMDMSLESVFASRKAQDDKMPGQMTPGAFQVSAKIDEESRKDNRLAISFLLTLNDPKSMATYEFRGTCMVTGNPADFDSMMEIGRGADARLPRILDAIYQRLYPSVFILAGLTSSPYPQSTTVSAESSVAGHATNYEESDPVVVVAEDKPEEKSVEQKPAEEEKQAEVKPTPRAGSHGGSPV